MKEMDRPIGVMDSGVGGLTVAKEIMRQLPNETIYYLGMSLVAHTVLEIKRKLKNLQSKWPII